MKFSLELLPNEPIDNLLELIGIAEDIGFENVWITDHYNNKNVFEILALAARETSTIHMGSGVSNPFIRNPVTIAQATTTLDEISNGRALLGIGPGDKATMNTLGIKWNKPLSAVADAVKLIRDVMDGKEVKNGARLTGTSKVQDNIPIYVGAQGPKMLELSGKIADGSLVNASSPKDFEHAMPLIRKGISNSANPDKDFNFAAYTACSVDEDKLAAFNQTKIVVAFIIAGAPEVVLNRHGISLESAGMIKEYLSKNDFKSAVATVDEDMVNAFSVWGTPSQINDKIEVLESMGVNEFVVGSPIGKDRVKSLKLLKDVINSFN
ncbi:MAG: 5,10-methylenetetrahydromethanopterin reductase [Methanosphaera sp.]|nr:5,10-methylenetetrahydromethanopterin reductase [Methanosphaera sp.]